MSWQTWLAFAGASVLIALSPGAGAVQSMATGLGYGVRRGGWSILGLEAGLMLQLTLVALGVGALVSRSVAAFTLIKWFGVAYLLYLAVRQWCAAATDLRERVGGGSRGGGTAALVLRGFLVNATNPKGLVFFLAVLPQFLTPGAPLAPQYLVMAVTMVAVDVVVMTGYTALAARLIRRLHDPSRQRMLNRGFAVLFATAATVLALVRRAQPA